MKFQFYLPVNLIFGRGKFSQTGVQTAKYGKKALLVTGQSSTKKSGLLDRTRMLLSEAGVETVVFDEVRQNPLTDTVMKGAAAAKEHGCDVIVGLGGGSALDAAKTIAFMAKNSGDLNEYIFNRKVSERALPIILIPTTCGTGSEGNGFAVLTNPETHDKKSLRCGAIIAKASIIDPDLMTTLPKPVLAAVGFDALCHNMEAYLSGIGQPMTDMMALEGIRLAGQYLLRAFRDRDDREAWDHITWASTLGGMVIGTAGVTVPHGMEHPASGLRDIVHGKGLAALTPAVFEETIRHAPKKFAVISELLGGRDEHDCVSALRKLLDALELTTTLGELGIEEADVGWMAENCQKVSAAGLQNHPVKFNRTELERIYRKAL